MAKNIRLESFKYHFLRAFEEYSFSKKIVIREFLEHLDFHLVEKGVIIKWEKPVVGEKKFFFSDFIFYKKGDSAIAIEKQNKEGLVFSDDNVQASNKINFSKAVLEVMKLSGLEINRIEDDKLKIEEEFHDNWADNELLNKIDVVLINEAATAPEMRYIHGKLGDINGKSLLDVGCGLGEASVYFAMQGANVTATDLSSGMLKSASKLARNYGKCIETHKASAESFGFEDGTLFDIVYTGNLLHHVDVEQALLEMRSLLKPGGVLVTWDPLHYNPIINNYRKKATNVRTPDEHPLKWQDLKLFNKHFTSVERKYFWLSSLLIFVIMALIQRRDPNKERYWKSVISESKRWAPLYWPLAAIDTAILFLVPPLRLLCWNVVIFSKK